MSVLQITGDPVVSFEFIGLPSWNKTYSHWRAKSKATKEYRAYGYRMGLAVKKQLGGKFAADTVMLVVKVYPPHEGIMDVFNVNIKAVTDGLTEAGVYQDDEWGTIPVCIFVWSGFSDVTERRRIKTGKRRGDFKNFTMTKSVIEVHRLDALKINGIDRPLPAGRVKIVVPEKPFKWAAWERIARTEEWN